LCPCNWDCYFPKTAWFFFFHSKKDYFNLCAAWNALYLNTDTFHWRLTLFFYVLFRLYFLNFIKQENLSSVIQWYIPDLYLQKIRIIIGITHSLITVYSSKTPLVFKVEFCHDLGLSRFHKDIRISNKSPRKNLAFLWGISFIMSLLSFSFKYYFSKCLSLYSGGVIPFTENDHFWNLYLTIDLILMGFTFWRYLCISLLRVGKNGMRSWKSPCFNYWFQPFPPLSEGLWIIDSGEKTNHSKFGIVVIDRLCEDYAKQILQRQNLFKGAGFF